MYCNQTRLSLITRSSPATLPTTRLRLRGGLGSGQFINLDRSLVSPLKDPSYSVPYIWYQSRRDGNPQGRWAWHPPARPCMQISLESSCAKDADWITDLLEHGDDRKKLQSLFFPLLQFLPAAKTSTRQNTNTPKMSKPVETR